MGYLSLVISNGSGAPLPDPMEFVVRASTSNPLLPDNVFLLCGDGNLEPMAPAISQTAAAPPLTAASTPWKWVHLIVRRLVENVAVTRSDRDWVVFIDTNPSFSIYTELAVCAVDRLITPVNADDSSRVATNAMFILLHGQTPPHPVYGSWTFAARAHQEGIAVPQIHLIVGNRLTQYGGPAAAYGVSSDATANTLFAEYQQHPQYFTPRPGARPRSPTFERCIRYLSRDFNTAGVVSAHLGRPLSSMTDGSYQVHGSNVTVDARPVLRSVSRPWMTSRRSSDGLPAVGIAPTKGSRSEPSQRAARSSMFVT